MTPVRRLTAVAAAIGRVVEGHGGPGNAEMKVTGATLAGAGRRSLNWVEGRPERIEFDVHTRRATRQRELEDLLLEPHAYGQALTRMLCADARIPAALARARREAETADIPLRLRLRLDSEGDHEERHTHHRA